MKPVALGAAHERRSYAGVGAAMFRENGAGACRCRISDQTDAFLFANVGSSRKSAAVFVCLACVEDDSLWFTYG